MGCVYLETCIPTGKVYIGQTIQKYEQYRVHRFALAERGMNKGRLLAAIRKYGRESFAGMVLAHGNTQRELHDLETFYIKFFGSQDNRLGYNVTAGGEGVRANLSHSEETKAKIRRTCLAKGIKPPLGAQAMAVAANTGAKRSLASRKRMSLARIGIRPSAETRQKMSESGLRRQPDSSETRTRKSVAAKKRGMSRSAIEAGVRSTRERWASGKIHKDPKTGRILPNGKPPQVQ